MQRQLNYLIDARTKANIALKTFGLLKVPLLFLARPKVLEMNEESCHVLIPFRRRVKNHLGSLYFGALAIGADTCVGLLAYNKIWQKDKSIQLVFKSFNAKFTKRAVGPTTFICEAGRQIDEMIDQVIASNERVHRVLPARAECNGEVVAHFELELSLKKK